MQEEFTVTDFRDQRSKSRVQQWRIYILTRMYSSSKNLNASRFNSFNFMQFLGKIAKSYVDPSPLPPEGLVPPPRGNTGSAPVQTPRLNDYYAYMPH